MLHERLSSRRNEDDIHKAEWDLARVSYFDPQGEQPRALQKVQAPYRAASTEAASGPG